MTPHFIIKAARRQAERSPHWQARSQADDVQWYEGYAEPGYPEASAGVCTGNWNSITRYHHDTHTSETIDSTMPRLAKLLERAGVELEWSDEWTSCEACNKLFRHQPDSYGWQMYGVIDDNGCYCADCIDPASHLDALEGQDTRCNTIDSINPAAHGYTIASEGHENGWNPGQNADPKEIGADLRALGITRYLFDLTSVGQFDLRFAVYVHDSEVYKLTPDPLREQLEQAADDGDDFAAGLLHDYLEERGLNND